MARLSRSLSAWEWPFGTAACRLKTCCKQPTMPCIAPKTPAAIEPGWQETIAAAPHAMGRAPRRRSFVRRHECRGAGFQPADILGRLQSAPTLYYESNLFTGDVTTLRVRIW